jgi:hypothetical protein
MFHIGQKVVCVDASVPAGNVYASIMPLKEGHEYTVQSIIPCSCGDPSINVGHIAPVPFVRCICGNTHVQGKYWHFGSRRFVSMEHNEEVNELVNELTEPIYHEI